MPNLDILNGLTGLIVEDNMIIALDAEQLLLDHGMAHVFTAANVAEARQFVETESVDVALLDVNLGSETSFSLIAPLNERGVPYVFVTGYGENLDLPPEAGATEAINKPFDAARVIEAVSRALARRQAAA
ncbi:response regulator [Aurantimonas sp. A2-1-M11]|uniref:response regulator n=1 Tax=Aurantimonas sp. A2-1-M11 TaxID=3113712 RepID=UPI002F929A22